VIVIHRDVLIRNDMDKLFETEAPAAVRRHPQGKDFHKLEVQLITGSVQPHRSKIILLGIMLKDGIV